MNNFVLDDFIKETVIKRETSMFQKDMDKKGEDIREKIHDKKILVIGGAGSIGSSFVRCILAYKPRCLVVVDLNENALTELTRDLRSTQNLIMPEKYTTYPIDYASIIFNKVLRYYDGFDIVANFSAHKHVRTEKDVFSIESLLRNNIINAKYLLDALSDFPPEAYFCVSTDKAANPVNIMGASKRIMEDLIFSYSDFFPVKTARFANVAFSNGSLPDGFLKRMAKLQPLSAPTGIRRFFVSSEEAGQICTLACVLGENREIFFPKLVDNQTMTFDEIAEKLLVANGYEVYKCHSEREAIDLAAKTRQGNLQYPVFFSPADTSGEKPFEEFYTDEETIETSRFSGLGVIVQKPIPDRRKIEDLVCRLEKMFKSSETEKKDIIDAIRAYLPNFSHLETGKNLDDKM